MEREKGEEGKDQVRTGLGSDLVRLAYIGGNEETVEGANGTISFVILEGSKNKQ